MTWLTDAMQSIAPIISSAPFVIATIITTILTLFIFWLRADNFRFTAFAYKRPWVIGNDHAGEFQKLAKQTNDTEIGDDKLVSAERQLCTTFKDAITGSQGAEVSETQFNNAKNYLAITGQSNIRPPHPIFRVFLFVLILAESVGTGFVLAPYMSTEITPAQANFAAGIIALSVAIILAMLTHVTGEELAQILRYSKNSGSEGQHHTMSLGNPQETDAFYIDPNSKTVRNNPPARRFSNRVTDPGKIGYLWLTISTVAIVSLMVALYALRVGGVEKAATETTLQYSQQNSQTKNDPSNMFGTNNEQAMPSDAVQASNEFNQKVGTVMGDEVRSTGTAAAFILALIYLVTQFTAFIIAFRTTFSGEGRQAYLFTRNFQSFETFKAKFLSPKIEHAEGVLAQLRTARAKGNHRCGTATFKEYLQLGVQKEQADKTNLLDQAATEIATATDEGQKRLRWEMVLKNHNFSEIEQEQLMAKIEAQSNKISRLSSGSTHDSRPAATTHHSIEQLASQFLEIKDKNQKVEFLEQQSEGLGKEKFESLRAEIKRQKDAAAAQNNFSDLLD